MSQKLNTPKGTRDFSSLELKKREYLLNVLKDCFKSFNFQEIQTPSFENLTTLTGKYGDDEDNLMFKILSFANAKIILYQPHLPLRLFSSISPWFPWNI